MHERGSLLVVGLVWGSVLHLPPVRPWPMLHCWGGLLIGMIMRGALLIWGAMQHQRTRGALLTHSSMRGASLLFWKAMWWPHEWDLGLVWGSAWPPVLRGLISRTVGNRH